MEVAKESYKYKSNINLQYMYQEYLLPSTSNTQKEKLDAHKNSLMEFQQWSPMQVSKIA